jgi:hypothetical protein
MQYVQSMCMQVYTIVSVLTLTALGNRFAAAAVVIAYGATQQGTRTRSTMLSIVSNSFAVTQRAQHCAALHCSAVPD